MSGADGGGGCRTGVGAGQALPSVGTFRGQGSHRVGLVRDDYVFMPGSSQDLGSLLIARKGTDKDERARQIEDAERAKFEKDMADEIKIVRESAYARVRKLLLGRTTTAKLVDDKGKGLLAKGAKISAEALDPIIRKYWGDIEVDKNKEKIDAILAQLREQTGAIEMLFQEKIDKLGKGDELPPGVIKMVADEGVELPDDFEATLREKDSAAFARDLQPVTGMQSTLEQLGSIRKCVASSGPPTKIRSNLETTGLLRYFDPYLFSAREVKKPKPAPDIFLLAADRMGREFESSWVRAYINLRGELPAGAPIALPDGRRGVVLGPGAVAGGYQLLVDGSLMEVRDRPQWVR